MGKFKFLNIGLKIKAVSQRYLVKTKWVRKCLVTLR